MLDSRLRGNDNAREVSSPRRRGSSTAANRFRFPSVGGEAWPE